MLALVTCHIFPPQFDTEKNEFLAPDFPADSSQFFRVHGFTSAVRQMPTAMRNPFAWTNVSSGNNACFAIWPHVGTKFFNLPHHFLSMDGWPGDAIFFLWGQPLKIIHKNSAKKKVQPLGFYSWHLRLGLFKSPFFGWWSWTYVVVPLLQGQIYFQKKKTVLQFGRIDTKFLNSSHHVLSEDDWPGDATFFPVGQPLRIIRKYSIKKRSSPLDFIFDTCASASSSHLFLVGEAEHMWLYPFCKDKYIFRKKKLFCNLGALTQNSWIRPIMSYLWIIGLVMRLFSCGPTFEDHPQVFSQKRSSPLDFIFDPCALASWSHFFGWWRWTYAFVPFCKIM